MKHLTKYNESLTFRELSDQVKDILVDIKDDYPAIDGDILDISDDKILCEVLLKCDDVKIEGIPGTVEHYRNKLKFINLILDSCQRLEDAFNTITYIPNLDDFDHWQNSTVKITLYKKK